MRRPGVGSAAILAAGLLVVGCAGDDAVANAADIICLAIDEEPDDLAAFEGYERDLARERRGGIDEQELRAALYDRCERAISAISAAANDPEAATVPAPEASLEEPDEATVPETVFTDLATVDWVDQIWSTECTNESGVRDVPLTYDEELGGVRRPTGGALTPVYVVELDRVVYGDVTGNGQPDAAFVTQCVFASAEYFVEVWTHDDEGQPLHLPPVRHFSKFDAVVDRLEANEGRLRIHSREGLPGDDAPHLNGYPIDVVTDWTFVEGTWRGEERSRSEPPTAVAGCETPNASPEDAALCLVAAVNAEDYELAGAAAGPMVVEFMRDLRGWGLVDWEFNGCTDTCWFYEPSLDPQYHGVGIEMGLAHRDGGVSIEWVETYG